MNDQTISSEDRETFIKAGSVWISLILQEIHVQTVYFYKKRSFLRHVMWMKYLKNQFARLVLTCYNPPKVASTAGQLSPTTSKEGTLKVPRSSQTFLILLFFRRDAKVRTHLPFL